MLLLNVLNICGNHHLLLSKFHKVFDAYIKNLALLYVNVEFFYITNGRMLSLNVAFCTKRDRKQRELKLMP